jgi:tetratricopeptide (TPR) repeat protein
MTERAPPMAVAQVDGRAVLTVAGQEAGAFIVERLEVEHPGVTASAPAQLWDRRGRLLGATLVAPRERLERRLRELAPDGGDGGLRLTLERGAIAVSGPDGAGRAPFLSGPGRTVRAAVEGEGAAARGLRHLLAELLGPALSEPPDAHDPLGPALDEVFVSQGFRLPASADARLHVASLDGERILLRWGTESTAAPGPDRPDDRTDAASARALSDLRGALEAAPAGPAKAEAAHRLAALCEREGDEDGAVAALQTCIENAGPGPLVAAAWQRLVELHARRGDPHAAARALIASADDARVAADESQRAGTLVAAAEILRKRLSLRADAGMLLERALALAPAHVEALAAMEALTAEAGDLGRLAEILEKKLEVAARGPREQKTILVQLAELYEQRLQQPELAARARARLEALEPAEGAGATGAAAPAEAAPPAGEVAERADPTYWRETGAEAEPGLRANALVAKARVALARGDLAGALVELDAALADLPGHAPALALAAEIAFRRQDWPRARELYGALERAPAAGEVVSHEHLVQRRAALAHRTGDLAEAEALYRELAILNPQQVEARRALAELALARGDTATAALRLEDLLRMLPPGAPTDVVDLRHRLGAIYAETGDWAAARSVLELVVDQDPGRVPALELLLQSLQKLGLPREADEVCGRLARLYANRGQRAAVLHRQAEIRRTQLDDPAGALDADLRSSDADPSFVPSRLRLVEHFWSEGDLDVVADLAGDLAEAPLAPETDADLIARLSMAVSDPRSRTSPRFPFGQHPALAGAAARALAETGDRAAGRGLDAIESILDPVLARARFWAGPDGERALADALIPMLLEDPARPGPALMLGSLAARIRRPALARAAFSLAAFVDPNGVAAYLLEGLPAAEPARGDVLRVGGPVDHPTAAGPARRALARLAPALLGLDVEQPAPKPGERSGLQPARAIELRRIADLLSAPPFVVAPDEQALRTTQPSGDRRRVRLVPTQPAALLISPNAANLSAAAWSFVAGRAIEALRSGLVTAGLNSADGLARIFEGARAGLGGAPAQDPGAQRVAEWLRRPEHQLMLGGADARAELLAEVEAALGALPDWEAFRRGVRHTCNRVGVLVSGNPVAALEVIAEAETAGDETPVRDAAARMHLLRGAAARELIAFLLDPVFETASGTA